MADSVQNVKIRFTSDVDGLKQADKALEGLNEEERKLVENFRKASKEADNFSKETKKAGNNVAGLGNIGKTVMGTIAGVFAVERVVTFTKNVINVTGQFQRLSAVLTNSLGSQSAAQRAMDMLEGWAARTPFSLAEATEAYVKLVNQGFRPTEEQMTKLADVAASTGKSFDQLTEALIDAQTGEFERLKEFGILAQKQGDKVTFAFKGVKTQVDFTNKSIRDYIVSLGDLEGVSGATAAISATLEGQVSNLGDSFDKLYKAIGNNTDSIIGKAISGLSELVSNIADAITPLEALIRRDLAGFTEDYVQQQKVRVNAFVDDIKKVGGDASVAVKFQMESDLNDMQQFLDIANKRLQEFDKEHKTGLFGTGVLSGIFKLTDEEQAKREVLLTDVVKFTELIKGVKEVYAETAKEIEKKTEKEVVSQKELDKIFQQRLQHIKEEEEIEKRKAQLRGASQGEIIKIEEEYNQRRIKLTEEFHKQKEFIYKDFVLKDKELEQEYTEFLRSEHRKRLAHQREIDTIRFSERDAKQKESLEKSVEYVQAYSEAMVKADEEAAARRKEIQDQGYVTFSNITNAIGQIRQNQLQAELMEIEEAREKDLRGLEKNEQAKLYYQQKYDKEERKIKREMAIAEKNSAIFTILLETAKSVMKASPVIPLMAFAGATGAAQLAVASSKPIPKYKKGTKSVPGIDTGDDSVLAMIRPGEAILPTEKNKLYGPSFAAMFDGTVPAHEMNRFVMDYQKVKGINSDGGSNSDVIASKLDKMNRTLENLKTTEISIDKNGIKTLVRTSQSETAFKNNYFRN